VGDSCDYLYVVHDDVWTDCTVLRVGNNGNYGDVGNRDGGGKNLDYTWMGSDCDSDADVYLFDGCPVICYLDGTDTIAGHAIFGNRLFHLVDGGNPTVPTQTTADYQVYRSGTFTTFDFKVGMEQIWYAPLHPDTCNFVIQEFKVYSFDGSSHSGMTIGQAIDWDIPSDDGSKNAAGYDSTYKLIYQRGVETDGSGCQSNDTRFGGIAWLAWKLSSWQHTVTTQDQPHGAYSASNPDYLWPNYGFVPSELYAMMHDSGYSICLDTVDQHVVMTFQADQTIPADDTLVFYSAMVTVRNGSIEDLRTSVEKARESFFMHIVDSSACCIARGNVDHITGPAGPVDVADLTYLVEYLFQGGSVPPCQGEANVDAVTGVAGPIDVADLTYLVAYLFQGGSPPPPCP